MPELADVEGFRRTLERHATGQRIVHVSVPIPKILRNTTPQGLGRALQGRALEKPRRHGKWLFAAVDGRTLVLHFGMTGDLAWTKAPAEPDPHDGVVLELESGVLRYRTWRKLGGVWLIRDESQLHEATGPLGPDAWQIEREEFMARLAERRGRIKSALMDQTLLAGLGNELSDEILWRARLAPEVAVPAVSESARETLFECMKEVLRESMRHGRIPTDPGWLERVRDDPEARCPRCHEALRRSHVAGRTAVWCPHCQSPHRHREPS